MRTLFEPTTVTELQTRIQRLRSDQPRQWGKMTVAQAMAHCSLGLEMAVGELQLPRVFIGRLIGPLVKRVALGNDEPFRPGSPTAPALIVRDTREFESERTRLAGLVGRFAAGGEVKCSTHPHPFFGRLTRDEWGNLMYKHLDHHLRQFGA